MLAAGHATDSDGGDDWGPASQAKLQEEAARRAAADDARRRAEVDARRRKAEDEARKRDAEREARVGGPLATAGLTVR